jgi:hypothetical protein
MPRRRNVPPEVLEREFDVVLPVQFFRAGPRVAMLPEHRLMLAVLEDAVSQLTRAPVTRETYATWAWFASDDIAWPYSFAYVSDALGLDASAVRAALGRRTVAAAA